MAKFKYGTVLCLAVTSTAALADDSKPSFIGTIEQFLVSGNVKNMPVTRDRFTRVMGIAEWGNWRAVASHWYYPSCGWYDLDETTLSFTERNLTLRAGRFLPPIAQANWEDEWYSGFVFIPYIETNFYNGRKLLERTSSGIESTYVAGPNTIKLAMLGSDPNVNRLFPKTLDRASLRVQSNYKSWTVGASLFTDTTRNGSEEMLRSVDFRWTVPQWILRGTVIGYSGQSEDRNGYYVDVTHRPRGWSDVTLVYRFEHLNTRIGGVNDLTEISTPGLKIRLPFDTTLNVNYTYGPSMTRIPLGGGWAFSLNRTIKF